jgi:hypothetical protein
MFTLLQIYSAAKEQRTDEHILRGNEVGWILKILLFVIATLISVTSESEGRLYSCYENSLHIMSKTTPLHNS